jgi:dimethylaniline monooxygenase (N-oxide forming)
LGWIVPRYRDGRITDADTSRLQWSLPWEYGAYLSNLILDFDRAIEDPVYQSMVDLNQRVGSRCGICGIYGTKTLSLPEAVAIHDCKVVGEITEVRDGGRHLITMRKELKNVDAVIFCTGFDNQVPFMPGSLSIIDPRKLYKHMFHPEVADRLGWIGWARPAFGSQFPIMELQARLFAQIVTGIHALPSRGKMSQIANQDAEMNIRQFEDSGKHIRSLVDYHRYMDDLASLIGCKPPLLKYFFLRHKLWKHLYYGPTQATQFRLRCPGKKVSLAEEIKEKLPYVKTRFVLNSALKRRLYSFLGAFIPRFIPKPVYMENRIVRRRGK